MSFLDLVHEHNSDLSFDIFRQNDCYSSGKEREGEESERKTEEGENEFAKLQTDKMITIVLEALGALGMLMMPSLKKKISMETMKMKIF